MDIDPVALAQQVIASGNIHDSGPRIDVLARSVLSLHSDNAKLRAALGEALRIADAANNDPGDLDAHNHRNERIEELWKEIG